MSAQPPITIPDGFTLHTENTSHILLPSTTDTFLNPIQEFNRDLSVACITTWSEALNSTKEAKWKMAQEKRAKKGGDKKRLKVETPAPSSTSENIELAVPDTVTTAEAGASSLGQASQAPIREFQKTKVVILEALSATGLRSIRYAKEIPLVKYVIANDLSPAAITAMKRNVDINGLGPSTPKEETESAPDASPDKPHTASKPNLGMVRVNEGDACALMYNHRADRVDVVDLDPYGTAAPFIDPAVQCINDGVRSIANVLQALRLVLHTVSTSASRYGRYIQPLLCLSIDFYVRLFIRIQTAPIEVKKAASCQASYDQPLGRITTKTHEASGNVNIHFKTHAGPTVPEKCPECHSTLHLAGPMWSGPIHDPAFVGEVLEHLENNQDKYATAQRMKGMMTVAKEELDSPFYFTPSKIAGSFHCNSPSLDETASALLHAGHKVSRSHAMAGSLKTSATRADLHDIFRSWVKIHPVKMENVPENSPTRTLLAKEPTMEHNFKRHPQSVTQSSDVKLVRYQVNPTSHWGPGSRPDNGKRKRAAEEE
ncbi:hypothetical protein HWV62_5885 [Athelia sp. TMB]|nr:hypothetical protein HWV62_5885 [Athelia sp. TMB]